MPVKKTAEKTAALAEVRSLLPRSVHAEEARERFTRRTDPRVSCATAEEGRARRGQGPCGQGGGQEGEAGKK